MPYDNEYDGPRWRYGLALRPITQYLAARDLETDEIIPWILHSQGGSDDPRFKRFGTFDCAAELSEITVSQFSLVLIKKIEAGGSLADAPQPDAPPAVVRCPDCLQSAPSAGAIEHADDCEAVDRHP